MHHNTRNSPLKILIRVTLLALIVQIIPFPAWTDNYMPLWLVLFFSYWLMFYAKKYQLVSAFIIGLINDLFLGDVLGQNAIALLVMTLFLLKIQKNFTMTSIVGQQIIMLMASILFLVSYLFVYILLFRVNVDWFILVSTISTALVWLIFSFWYKR